MDSDENQNKTIKMDHFNFYKLITFILITIIVILSYYFSCVKWFRPILFFLVIFIIKIIRVNEACNKKDIQYVKLAHRSILLLCTHVYLFLQVRMYK